MTAPSKHHIMLMFEHPACDVVVDIHLPLPDPIEESTEVMAERVRPLCPSCKEPMRYSCWSFSDYDENDDEAETERVR